MQHDEVIWQVINHQFCSFKTKLAEERNFCQNPFNVTGLCIRSACPLANSRYATIREEEGICYLYIKTIERAHTPKKLWEKIKLPRNYAKALEIVSEQLEFFPKYLVHRNKQRLTKIHQMIIRMRKLKLKARPKITTTNSKVEKREKGKERKALRAAQLDRAIENELLERLKTVYEGEIYNYPEREYSKALKTASKALGKESTTEGGEDEEELEDEEGNELEEEEEEEEDDGPLNVEYVEDLESSDDEEEDIEYAGQSSSFSDNKRKGAPVSPAPKRAKGTKYELEYEEEEEEPVAKHAVAVSSSRASSSRSSRR